MTLKTLFHTLITIALVVVVWPLIGWLALYSQYERQTAADRFLTTFTIEGKDVQLEPGRTHLRFFPVPAIELYNARLHVEGLSEPVRLAHATWRSRWYSPWVFQWLPERFIVRNGQLLQDASLAGPESLDELWPLVRHFHQARDVLGDFQALEVEELSITLFDPDTENVLDLRVAGELRRTMGGVELQSITDLSGDGWVDHGFLRLHGRWTPAEQFAAPLLLQSVDAHLEFTSLTREYGLYQWSADAENLRFNPEGGTIRADYLVLGTGRSDGTELAEAAEYGERTAINSLVWRDDETNWRADNVQRAVALQPHHSNIRDVRWLLDSDQWRTGGSDQVGRTQLTWEMNLAGQPVNQVRAQMIQAGGRAPSLDRWEADSAEVTLSVLSADMTQSMTGWGSVSSDVGAAELSITGGEFSEQRQEGDTLWLYGDFEITPQGMTLSDMSGTLRGSSTERQSSLEEWVSCWGDWSPFLIVVVTQCTEPAESD
ncbi:MAG: hypothetical protein LAT62_01185 [Natronospirillum sp.]|uniref:hypothetical protein n=1 Tax=Natronospirillum sp. TaxID=2812955 RepID=UPI0025E32F0E|nr:hypothetical protein [Natronospirillum sp.]MCH8550516.1 hypothetical protein [Natronospirillum sp.]